MILLRKAKEEDLPIIQALAKQTWPAAYSALISVTQIEYMLEKMYNKGELLEQLEKGHTFFIAEEENKDLGFAGFSLIDPAAQTYKLHKLYVLPEAHGKGIGKILINEVQNQVIKAGGRSIELNVNRANKAVDFYTRAGFTIKETIDLDIGNGFFMNDYILQKHLL